MFHVPEKHRVRRGDYATTEADGNNGAFWIDLYRNNRPFRVIASDGEGFEHVSVSMPGRKGCPTWEEMCAIKDIFWDAEDAVIQIHPPASEYVNCHPYTLHLWRQCGTNDFCKAPPRSLV